MCAKICIFIKRFWLSLIAIAFSVVALCRTCPRLENLNFDYMGVIVGILSLLITILIGWNIFQVVDLKTHKRDVELLKEEVAKEINYIHNKVDFNTGMGHCVNAQVIASSLCIESKCLLKYQMIYQCLLGVKTLSNLNEFKSCSDAVDTVCNVIQQTSDLILTDEERQDLKELFYTINSRDEINRINELRDFLETK